MKNEIATIILAGGMVISMVACGKAAESEQPAENQNTQVAETTQEAAETTEETTEAATEEATEPQTGLANPWREVTEDQADAIVPLLFKAPEGATNVVWRTMGEWSSDFALPGPMVEMDFDLDGMSFTERAQTTGDEQLDISGTYYDWTVSDTATLNEWFGGGVEAQTSRYVGDSEYVDLCTWYDVEIGVSYSLSVSAPDLDGFDILAVVDATFAPEKHAGANAPDDEREPMDITGCDTFTQIVDKLQAGQGYANAQIDGKDVLLVASGTYDADGPDGGDTFGAIDADIYMYDEDGSILYLGYVRSTGTAYPLAIDKDGYLDVGTHHSIARMTISEDNKIVSAEEAYELFDNNGNVTYYRWSDTEQVYGEQLEDDSLLTGLFDEYWNSEIISFNTVQ